MTLFHAIQGAGGVKPAATTVVDAQIPFTYAGTYSVKVPSGVTSMCMLCVGAGGSGGGTNGTDVRGGGGGGALSYSNAVAVTPGETLTVVVGRGGAAPASGADGNPGGDSSVSNSGGTLVLAKGGSAGTTTSGGAGGVAASGTGDTKQTGGAGGDNSADVGSGGGGAAGYSGTGGKGGFGTTAATAGTGGGGGGGGFGTANTRGGAAGGGVGLFGEGSNGTAGTGGASSTAGGGGSGGSLGLVSSTDAGGSNSETGSVAGQGLRSTFLQRGCVGGGGGSANDDGAGGGSGAAGGVSLIWGSGRSFPSTNVSELGMFIRAFSESTTSTIVIPSTTQVGDLILFVDRPVNTSGLPTEVVPGDFTNLSKLDGPTTTTTRQYVNYKVAVSGDAGATVTGMNGNSTNQKGMIVLGTTIASPTWTFSAVNAEITDGSPAAQTVNTSTLTKYNAAVAFNGTSGTVQSTNVFTPWVSAGLTVFGSSRLAGTVSLNGYENFTVDATDQGTNNACQSFYVTVQ